MTNSISEVENSFCILCDLVLVRHTERWRSLAVEILEEPHDLSAGLSVESPGFIRQDKTGSLTRAAR
jgi:hypothetical protein